MEQSVIELCSQSSRRPECVAESSAGAGSLWRALTEPAVLPRPVRLDPLVPEVTPNSLCSLTGQSRFQPLWFHLIVLLCFLYPHLFCLYQGCPDPVLEAPKSSRVFCPTRVGPIILAGVLQDWVWTLLRTCQSINTLINDTTHSPLKPSAHQLTGGGSRANRQVFSHRASLMQTEKSNSIF